MTNIFKKALLSFRRSFGLLETAAFDTYQVRSYSGQTVSADSALGLSAVWGCLNLIAGTGGSLPCLVYEEDGAGVRRVARGHPLYALLHDSPNAEQTALDFWEGMFASVELYGSAYASIERARDGRIIALVPIQGDTVQVKRLQSGDLSYRWVDGHQQYERRSDGVLHIRGFGGSPLGGLSTLAYARNSFGLAMEIERSAGVTFANGLRPSGALTFDTWLTNDQRKLAEASLVERYMGATNQGRPLILEGNTTWQPFSINPEDAQMLQSRAFSVEEICRFFHVPPIMIGHGDKTSSWGTGIAEVTQGFVKYTMRRRLRRVEMAVMKQLLSPVDRMNGVKVEFAIEGLLRGDSLTRAKFYASALEHGWMTINRVRELENEPPIEGGDVVRMQMQNVPLGSTDAMGEGEDDA